MLNVKHITKKLADYNKVIDIYKSSFPEHEKLPILLLRLMTFRNCVDFYAFYDETTFCGFAYLIHHNQTTFVLYLAIDSSIRSKGYGTLILNWISNNYSNNTIFLNIETIDENSENYSQRLKRQDFYKRNGYIDSGYKINDKGNVYDVLYKGDCFSKNEYNKLLNYFSFGVFSPQLSKDIN